MKINDIVYMCKEIRNDIRIEINKIMNLHNADYELTELIISFLPNWKTFEEVAKYNDIYIDTSLTTIYTTYAIIGSGKQSGWKRSTYKKGGDIHYYNEIIDSNNPKRFLATRIVTYPPYLSAKRYNSPELFIFPAKLSYRILLGHR